MRMAELQAALQAGMADRPHDQGLFAEARERDRWQRIATAPEYRAMWQEVCDGAARYRERPIKVLPYSLFRLFRESGSRVEYETEYFEHRDRLNLFALRTLAEDADEDRRALEDTIWAICDEYTWCLPAHLGESPAAGTGQGLVRHEAGILRETLRPQERMLDLFAAETAFTLAEIVSLLAERLAPAVVLRARSAILQRVIEPYGGGLAPAAWWETTRMNWAAVCAGSIGAAALYLIEDPAILAPLLQRVLATLDCYLDGFGRDGASTEGIGYWSYGFGFYTYFAALLKQRTAGRIDLLRDERVKPIALFQQQCYLTGNAVVSFSDTNLTQRYLPGLGHYLQKIFPEVLLPEPEFQARLSDDYSAHRWAHAVRNLVWHNPEAVYGLTPTHTVYLPDAAWFIAKQATAAGTFCFAAKGGHNDEPHNHNDLGSFLLHVNGDDLLADPGSGQYTRQYFGAERYDYVCTSSRGHSVPIIDGQLQKPGREHAARIVGVQTGPDRDMLRMELAPAYGNASLRSLLRQFTFEKHPELRLILRDEFVLEQPPAAIVERLVSLLEPRLRGAGIIELEGLRSRALIRYDPQTMQPAVRWEQFIAHSSETRTVYLIDFALAPSQARVVAELEIRLAGERR
ncbi:heparinase II/III-like protein [Hydrogenispora ethanolica]|uniref:Heparinase II/III-like protein n=1 Tax=Hydrogenispora ethanolica TaxID=1082276 RepID=A0A4R1RXU5_HYDET|nr:heparinase II/III family protein [Hydrogenispora ethanolica]TCL70802.1 heparinase II/III-like protein [Hydrogenispora ethanolica]